MSIPNVTLNDGHRIPQLGFGVWQVSRRDIVRTVSAALEVGYRHIDTASAYGNEAGVGQAIRESDIPREDLFITTKLDNSDQGRARQALEDSLRRLGLDYLDLYLIHWPVPGLDKRVEAWEAMEQAQAEGLIRSIGVSNFTPRYLTEIIEHGSVVPAVNQIEYHPTFQQRDVETANAEHGIVTEAYSPLGMGSAPRNRVVADIAERTGRTSAQVVLRWHVQAGPVVIPKSVTPPRIAENFAVSDFQLSSADLAAIDALDTGKPLGWDPETVRG
ncbi:aldo/keto reductase [Nonomuraea sp. NPDC005650]|uniref:aldo/keto reductase n=1 Tax=Nonomuraea sp. NPDC005650 TaxID=3157045 RepID=UPI0033A819FE